MKVKFFIFVLSMFLSCNIFASVTIESSFPEVQSNVASKDAYQSLEPYHFKIQKKCYNYSTFFEIDSDDTYVGNIKKSCFRIGDHYDLSDKDGWCATGVRRILSLGSFCDWAADIDICGVHGEHLGFIEGKMITTGAAKYYIYNREDQLVAIAYRDLSDKGVTITVPGNETYPLARLNRIYVPNISDHWEVVVYEPKKLDDRIVRVFAAFCLDVQESFHEDL